MAETFGKYELIERLASGGMAEVFLANQSGPGGFERPVAVKRIKPALTENETALKMFLDEARIAARLNHPNIVQTIEFGEVDKSYFLVMEYIEGLSLTSLLDLHHASGDSLSPIYAARIAGFVCAGLDYAHNFTAPDRWPLNLIHRDISPQNIMISTSGVVKIIDFGVAKAASNLERTKTGVRKGKLPYMSPEQFKSDGRNLDRRSDIFSLGVVFFEMLTGQLPFMGKNDFDIMSSVVYSETPDPRSSNEEIPAELVPIVFRALEKKPENRYPSARAMGDDLEQFLFDQRRIVNESTLRALVTRQRVPGDQPILDEELQTSPDTLPEKPDPGERDSSTRDRSDGPTRKILVAGLVAFLILGGFLLFLWIDGPKEPNEPGPGERSLQGAIVRVPTEPVADRPPPDRSSGSPEPSPQHPDQTLVNPSKEKGLKLMRDGQFIAALDAFDVAMDADPKDCSLLHLSGFTALQADYPILARGYLEQYLKICPKGEKVREVRQYLGIQKADHPATQ
jgi:serine/threonine protein kinase